MNELILSDNLAQIESEIKREKERIGKSVWEIGARLKHVKEHDLTHGQFMSWYQGLGFNKNFVSKAIAVADNLSNFPTLGNIGTEALYLIATLPEEEKEEQIQRIEDGDTPTVRELQEIKKRLKLSQQANELLRGENSRLKEATVKEVVKEVEVTPPDYQEALRKARESEAYAERNAFLEQQLNQLSEQRDKANKYDDLERAIEQGRGQLNEQQKEISSTKEAIAFLKKGNQFLANFGGVAYLDIQSVLPKNAQLKAEVETFASQLKILLGDVNTILGQSRNEILEGEIL